MTGSAPADAQAAIDQATAELERLSLKGELEGDPLRPVLLALAASVGAMRQVVDRIEAGPQALTPRERDHMTRQLVQACQTSFVRQAGAAAGRRIIITAAMVVACSAALLGGGYVLGRSSEAAAVANAIGPLREALSDGSASAQVWADAIRRNDLPRLLARCEAAAVWMDSGRRACNVPLWLEDPPRQPPQP